MTSTQRMSPAPTTATMRAQGGGGGGSSFCSIPRSDLSQPYEERAPVVRKGGLRHKKRSGAYGLIARASVTRPVTLNHRGAEDQCRRQPLRPHFDMANGRGA